MYKDLQNCCFQEKQWLSSESSKGKKVVRGSKIVFPLYSVKDTAVLYRRNDFRSVLACYVIRVAPAGLFAGFRRLPFFFLSKQSFLLLLLSLKGG